MHISFCLPPITNSNGVAEDINLRSFLSSVISYSMVVGVIISSVGSPTTLSGGVDPASLPWISDSAAVSTGGAQLPLLHLSLPAANILKPGAICDSVLNRSEFEFVFSAGTVAGRTLTIAPEASNSGDSMTPLSGSPKP